MKNKILALLVSSAICLSQRASAQTNTPGTAQRLAGAVQALPAPLKPSANEKGFKSMFDRKDLDGWDGAPELWSVKDGAITGQTTKENPAKENTFLIWTNGTAGDFEMRCSFKLTPGDEAGFANSGVQYRSRQVPSTKTHKMEYWVVAGYQADMENGPSYTGILYEEKMRGIMANRGEKVVYGADGKKKVVGSVGNAAEIEAAVKKGDWNDYIILAKGNHVTQIINGHITIDLVDEDTTTPTRSDRSGIIALQIHAGHPMMCQWKNLRIKNLK